MPSIKSFTMTYASLNDNGTFSEGDTLCGRITLVLFKETTVESLYVKAKGDADVRWTRKSGDHTYTYSAEKRYFKEKQFLIPQNSDTVLPEGVHVYDFRLNIPTGSMPSSFKGSHGTIVYSLEANLSRSWRMDRSIKEELKFVSKSIPDLRSLMRQQVGSVQKEMGLFSKGRAHMDVIVDRQAYAPGDTMVIVAKINNSSSSEMTPKLSLTKNVVFHAKGSTKDQKDTVFKVPDKCIQPQTQKEVRWAVKIPPDQTQTITNCELITVNYYLKVYLDISFAFDPEVVFPVVIIPAGLVPAPQSNVAAGPYPAGAFGGPSTSDFPPRAVSHSAFPHSGSPGYPAAQRYSPSSAPPNYPPVYPGPSGLYPAQPARVIGGYNNPAPPLTSPYGSPFSSSSVLHPPPSAPTFNPPPSAPKPPTPPSAPEVHPPPYAPEVNQYPSSPVFNISPTAPAYSHTPSAPMMSTDFLSESDEAPPSYSLLFPSSAPETDAK